MNDAFALLVLAGFELIVLTIVTAVYYYEAIRGMVQHHPELEAKAERMFGVASGFVAFTAVGMGLLLWWPQAAWAIHAVKVMATVNLAVIIFGCVRWMLGSLVHRSWYFIPWKEGSASAVAEGAASARAAAISSSPPRL